MNGKIALRDIIKAIVILKPGATMAVIQRMIWKNTKRNNWDRSALHGSTRVVHNKEG